MKVYSANLQSQGKKYAIVLARFNEFIVSKLLDGCLDGLKRHGAVSYTHLTLPTKPMMCRSRWSPYH